MKLISGIKVLCIYIPNMPPVLLLEPNVVKSRVDRYRFWGGKHKIKRYGSFTFFKLMIYLN